LLEEDKLTHLLKLASERIELETFDLLKNTLQSLKPTPTIKHSTTIKQFEMIFVQPFSNNFLTTFSLILTLSSYSLSIIFDQSNERKSKLS